MSGPLSLAAAWGPGVRAGIDEAGRGPLAGPVFAAAVVLDPGVKIDGLDDSKRLSPARREALREEIVGRARGYGVGRAEVREIDRLNILQATLLAMKRAFDQLAQDLGSVPDEALVDGRICPGLDCPARGLVKGDASVAEIAAASILAKVGRDREMLALNEHYPLYRFDRHKGYPTALHLGRLAALGVSPVHRRSFAPVRALLE